MLKPKKRLTKRQIKEDKFVTSYFKTTNYIQEHSRTIALVGGGILLLVVIAMLYMKSQGQKEEEVAVAFTKAHIEYQRGNYQGATHLFEELVENYGNTGKGKLAKYYLGNSYFKLEDYEKAENSYRAYLKAGDDELLKASALSGVAACLEERGNYEEAAERYAEAARENQDSVLAPQNLYDAGRCFQLAGQSEQAGEMLQKLIEQYPNSGIKNDAEILLAELGPVTPGAEK